MYAVPLLLLLAILTFEVWVLPRLNAKKVGAAGGGLSESLATSGGGGGGDGGGMAMSGMGGEPTGPPPPVDQHVAPTEPTDSI
jgi:hypothetical protein